VNPGKPAIRAFYVEKVGLQALESGFLKARDGQVGLTVGDGVSQLFVYPARARSPGEFTQAVIHVSDVRAAVEEMRGRGVEFEEYDTPETRTENGVARMPGGGEAAWFKDSEGNLVGVVPSGGELAKKCHRDRTSPAHPTQDCTAPNLRPPAPSTANGLPPAAIRKPEAATRFEPRSNAREPASKCVA
jgi:Glyoxalase/Bleomycin resistance protein/Dioxygenase superfamily